MTNDFINQQKEELVRKKLSSIKSALKFGAICGTTIIFGAEAFFELEGKDPIVNIYPTAMACIIGFLVGFLFYYLYSRNKN
jgi:hypothetical protein